MTKLWAFIRHNSGMVIGVCLCVFALIWIYGCPSQVTSITNAPDLVTRAELDIEVDFFLEMAEIRYAELDRQDEFKHTVFAVAIAFLEGGSLSPGAIALLLGNILGLGAIIDNVRKRTVINVLKGGNVNANKKVKT